MIDQMLCPFVSLGIVLRARIHGSSLIINVASAYVHETLIIFGTDTIEHNRIAGRFI